MTITPKPKEDLIEEYEEQCPKGLDYPLQDIETCQGNRLPTDGKSCEYYKRRKPQKCTWMEWKKEEGEKLVVEEPAKELIADPDSSIEIKELVTVRRWCDSDSHGGPRTCTHRKEVLDDGLVKYTCALCGGTTFEDAEEQEDRIRRS